MPCRLGVPSGMRGGENVFAFSSAHGWNFAETDGQPAIIGRFFEAWPDTVGDQSNAMVAMPAASRSARSERETFIFKQPEILFLVPVQDHAHLPRTREHLRILDRRLVGDVIRVERRVPFDDVPRVAVENAGAIGPTLVDVIRDVHEPRVGLPAAAT